MDLESRTALISGASSGIGECYARSLAALGYNLVITARRADRLKKLAQEIQDQYRNSVELLPADLSDPAGLEAVKARLGDLKKPVDYLVLSAGFGTRGHLADLDESLVTSMVNLHCLAAATLVRAALPGMISRNCGRIILVSSLASFLTTAEYTLYSATKSFLNTMAIGLRDELAASNVRVQSVCPGLVKTEFIDSASFEGFHYDAVPDRYWLSADVVVSESLRRIEKHYRPILVPGFGTKLFMGVLSTPLVGSVIKSLIAASSRRRIRQGKPAIF